MAEVLPQDWEFWTPHQAPHPDVWHHQEENPQHLVLRASNTWGKNLHRIGENGDYTLGKCRKSFTCTGAQGKILSMGQTNLLILQGLLRKQGAAGAHCGNKETSGRNTREYSLASADRPSTDFLGPEPPPDTSWHGPANRRVKIQLHPQMGRH